MVNNLYKRIGLALVAGIIALSPASAQDTKAKEKSQKDAKAAANDDKAAAKDDKAAIAELREKQKTLIKQLNEVNQQISQENRKAATANRVRLDSVHRLRLRTTSGYHLFDSAGRSHVFRVDTTLRNRISAQTRALAAAQGQRNLELTTRLRSLNGQLNQRIYTTSPNLHFDFDKEVDMSKFQGIEKSKTYSKSYAVDGSDKLAINNQYGKVTINTWDKKEVKVDVEIKAYDGSDDEAQKLLDAVKIEDSKASSLVSFKTVIDRQRNSNWFTRTVNGKVERHGVVVNYVVYMPAKSSLDVTNRFGAVILPNLDGVIKASVSNGSLKAGRLTNPANEIRASYGSATIESLQSGQFNFEYGRAEIGTANNVNLAISHAPNSKIGYLVNGGDLNLKYSGNFTISQLGPQLKAVNIVSEFSPNVQIMPGTASFTFDVSVKNAVFDYKSDKVNITSKEPQSTNNYSWSATKNYKGQYGKASDSKVVIRSSYGSVQFL